MNENVIECQRLLGDRYDLALRLHEAAHAVTAEVLRPGVVLGIQMDYVGGSPDVFLGEVFADDTAALCSWTSPYWVYEYNFAVAVAAGRRGELMAGDLMGVRFDGGDQRQMREWFGVVTRDAARRKAKRMARRHEATIRRLADVLARNRVLTGDEIRRVMN